MNTLRLNSLFFCVWCKHFSKHLSQKQHCVGKICEQKEEKKKKILQWPIDLSSYLFPKLNTVFDTKGYFNTCATFSISSWRLVDNVQQFKKKKEKSYIL